MKITIETENLSELEQIIALLEPLDVSIQVNKKDIPITPGNKSINPKDFFGMRKDNPLNLEEIRSKAWKNRSTSNDSL